MTVKGAIARVTARQGAVQWWQRKVPAQVIGAVLQSKLHRSIEFQGLERRTNTISLPIPCDRDPYTPPTSPSKANSKPH